MEKDVFVKKKFQHNDSRLATKFRRSNTAKASLYGGMERLDQLF